MHAVINKKHQNRQSATDKAAMLHFQELHHSVVNSTGSLAVNDYTKFQSLEANFMPDVLHEKKQRSLEHGPTA